MTILFRWVVFVLAATLTAAGWGDRDRSLSAATRKPNIVFILIDDLGWADLSCYGNKFHQSPNIDRLAAQGMRFTDAYAAGAVCSPTRASLMTGKYPATLAITDFIPGHWRPWEKMIVPKIENQLPLKEKTIAEALRDVGYATMYLGKWHLGGRSHFPDRQGFDEALVQSGSHFGTRLVGTREVQLEPEEYLADRLTDEALAYIDAHQEEPFFLYLSHYAVHIPLQAKKPTIAKYEARKQSVNGKSHPTYAAMIEHVDESVGRILDRLDELGIADETLVIFFSDNGGLIQRFDGTGPIVSTNVPLRSEKGSLYEGGIRVPLIIRWPGIVPSGTTSGVPVSSVDLFPTMMDLADVKIDANHRIDGTSLKPLVTKTGPLRRNAIYWHYPHYHHMDPAGAVRAGDFKLIERYDNGELELYRLTDDIGEKRNLADQLPEKAAELRGLLTAWRKSVGARMPAPNPDYDAEKAHLWKRRPRNPNR